MVTPWLKVAPFAFAFPDKVVAPVEVYVFTEPGQLSVMGALTALFASQVQTFESVLRTRLAAQVITGRMVSLTVTMAEQVELLLLTSNTVSVTVFAPVFAQVKAEFERVGVWIPHASEDPLFTAATVVLAFPPASRKTVTFPQFATGLTVSLTVRTPEQELVFPFWSPTVTITVLLPTFAQEKLVGDAVNEAMPQLSVGRFAGGAGIITAPKLSR